MEGSYYENHRQEIYRRLFLDGGSFLSLHGKKKFGFVLFFEEEICLGLSVLELSPSIFNWCVSFL
jgi:hypothetical protein